MALFQRASAPLVALSAIVLLLLAPGVQAQVVLYNLAGDWSDISNPNGPWSYNAAPGMPLTNHLANYSPGQPAWAFAAGGSPSGSIPVFMKITMPFDDMPVGRVDVHNNDGANSPPGLANAPIDVSWTAPTAGTIQISGGMWQASRFLGRTQDWALKLNGFIVSDGVLTSSSMFTSATPLNFDSGSGGLPALSQLVAMGDVLSLEYSRHVGESLGTHMGVDFAVQFTAVPEPSSMLLVSVVAGMGIVRRIRSHRRKVTL